MLDGVLGFPDLSTKGGTRKGLSPGDGLTAYQLVGEVTAHQGDDG